MGEGALKGHNIRAVTIDDAPWFVAADVCKALGLTNTATAVAKSVNPIDTNT
ncbi:BRO family protein [Rhodobacter lacus]|uniref:BRO family protein n=1 Tax=Rhodobacter lacus TaxID=1641972 RepID=A0ABW5AD64_9RHOB